MSYIEELISIIGAFIITVIAIAIYFKYPSEINGLIDYPINFVTNLIK